MPQPDRTRGPADAERALVARANDGDEAAFDALYTAHRDWVVALAMRITRNREDALDVTQDVFVYLFSKFPGFELTASLRGFLYPAVKHRSISAIRRRRKTDSLSDAREGDARAVQPEGASDFARLTQSLPEGQREVVTLRFGFDFRLAEIAEALEIPLGTVKSRLHNALKSLKDSHFSEESDTRRAAE